MDKKSKIFSVVILLVLFSATTAYAEQVPGAVLAVETNPYYFSEGGIGIGILKFFERPLTPYLVEGKTNDQSTTKEIYEAYIEHTKSAAQASIVDDKDRVMTFITEFSNGDFKTPLTINTFTKFTHISKDIPANVPYYYQNVQYGLELESLPSHENKQFYDFLVSPTINPGKKPEPFDVTIKMLTGDGNTLQEWKYQKCTINAYTPYLDENLSKVKFVGAFISEIRDKTSFECKGFEQDFVLKETLKKSETTLMPILPEPDKRANRVVVQFSGGEFTNTTSLYTFSKFLPLAKDPEIPISIPGNVIGEKPRFLLESLPTKDKEAYYRMIGRYVNPGDVPQPFDVTIHMVTAGGEVLQSWKYTNCAANNYSVFFIDNLLFYKFKQAFGSEIREKTFFDCNGLQFNPKKIDDVKTDEPFVPNSNMRAQVFAIHFEGPDIVPPKTMISFTKFSPITHEEIALLLPNAPFGEAPKFYLSSLPSKDNIWYYDLVSRYINAGAIPENFNVAVDVLLGDGTKIQTWKYSDCQVLEFKSFVEDSLAIRKFTNMFEPEVRDRTIFECAGLAFDSAFVAPSKAPEKPLDYVDFIPPDDARVKTIFTTLSGGDLDKPYTIYTTGKFQPKMEQRSLTERRAIGLEVSIIPDVESGEPRPEHPIELPPSEPTEPGASGPSYTVLVTKPHISTTQRNDYIKSTEFTMETLPSKDKAFYYKLISDYINPGKKPEPMDFTFDLVTGDGSVLQSWKYADCQLKDFRIKLRDNLLYFAMSGLKGATDISDVASFRCNGFSVETSPDIKYDKDIASTPTSYDRAMLHLVHWYGGELMDERTVALAQEFESVDDTDLLVSGLPNSYNKDVYEFIGRYVNPGKVPEPIDMRIDTLTGDGTLLYSTTYGDCKVTDSITFYIDTMAIIRYVPGLESEIRGQSILDCAGIKFNVPTGGSAEDLKKISPMLQAAIGVDSGGVECNEGLTLMIRPPKNVPVCAKSDSVDKLQARGWEIVESAEGKKLMDVLRPSIPSESERATSFTVEFEGTDISPQQTVKTFSKFVPIADGEATIQMPSNPLDLSNVSFYLESLSSKDKEWYYKLASRYVNPVEKPQKFNVAVRVNDGNGEQLQLWQYRECEILQFVTYYDDSLLKWKFHGKWQSEFKDKSVFGCAGLVFNS